MGFDESFLIYSVYVFNTVRLTIEERVSVVKTVLLSQRKSCQNSAQSSTNHGSKLGAL